MTFKEFIKKDSTLQENWWSWHTKPSKDELKDREYKINIFQLNKKKDKEFAEKITHEYELTSSLAHFISEYIKSLRNKDDETAKDLSEFLSNNIIGAGLKFVKIKKEIDYYLKK